MPVISIPRELSGFRIPGVRRRRKRAHDDTASPLHVAVRTEAGVGRLGVKTARTPRKTATLLAARYEITMLPAQTKINLGALVHPPSCQQGCRQLRGPSSYWFLFLRKGGRPAGNKL